MRRQCAKPESAAACFTEAAARAAAAGDSKLEGAAAFFAGLAHQSAEKYAEAIPFFDRSAAINRDLKSPAQEASALLNKASCLQQLGETASAIPLYEKVLGIRRAAGDREGIARSLYGIAMAHFAMGDPARALDGYRRSLPYWREIKQQFGEADTHNALGLVYAQLGDTERAAGEYEDALKSLVKRKAAGKPVKTAEREAKPDNVISLMDALRQSLKGKASAKRAAHSPARRASHRPAKKVHRSAARARKAG